MNAQPFALPGALRRRLCAARIHKQSALLHGRLVCGKNVTCPGHLGYYWRSYTGRSVPAGFAELLVETFDAPDGAALEDARLGDFLRFQLPNGYKERPAEPGQRLPFRVFEYSQRARERRQEGRKPATRRAPWPDGLETESHPNLAVECPTCGALNVVNRAVLDRQIVARYQALPYQLRIECYLPELGLAPGDLQVDYYACFKDAPAVEWLRIGGGFGRLGAGTLEGEFQWLTAERYRRDRRDYRGSQEEDEREREKHFLLGDYNAGP